MDINELKESLLPIRENKEFERKLQQLEGIQFENLQEYVIALDKLYIEDMNPTRLGSKKKPVDSTCNTTTGTFSKTFPTVRQTPL